MDSVVAFSVGAELGTSDGWGVVAIDGLWLGFIVVASTVGTCEGAVEGDWLNSSVGAAVVGA